jgi:tetratricopeptide (TPR) repeat protein
MTIALQTTSTDLTEKLNSMYHTGRYTDKNSFEWRQIKRDCEKLIQADAAAGWAALGNLHAACGDVDEVERFYSAALKLNSDPSYGTNLLKHLLNLGFFSKAQALYHEIGNPVGGQFSNRFELGFTAGAFFMVVKFIETAKNMGIDVDTLQVEIMETVAGILDRAGYSDDDVKQHLEAVGEVMRANKVFYAERPQFEATDVDGEFCGVTMIFRLQCSRAEAFDFNLALAEQEEKMGIKKNPAFDAIFLPLAV